MTAVHCARAIKDGTFPLRQVRIAVGRTVLNSRQGVVRRIAGPGAVRIHPRYTGKNAAFDVAVIRLNKPVGVKPIQLDRAGSNALERPGRRMLVAGWGLKQEPGIFGGSTVDRMREARPPIVSDRKCRSSYASLGDPSLRVFPRLMVCAGQKKLDTCQGDSGGPLFAPVRGGYRQVGVTSFGNGCGRSGYPGVYTELSAPSINKFVRQVSGAS
jgi:secreted trypsin-like serine protease